MASGDTKTEAMLNALGNGGSADEFRGCCNTKTQQYILDAIDRVQNVEDEVEELKNNPDVVDIVDTYADLQAYDKSTLTDKDIIRVLEDSTHSNKSTYYRYSASTDSFTYIGEAGGGVNVVQTPGNSQTDVMSQDAATGMVFADTSTRKRVRLGNYAQTTGDWSVAIGSGSNAGSLHGASAGNQGVAIGYVSAASRGSTAIGAGAAAGDANGVEMDSTAIGADTNASYKGSVALGARSATTRAGEVYVGTSYTQYGYNSTNYRVIGGVHDPVDAHDAATKGYVDANAGGSVVYYVKSTELVDGQTVHLYKDSSFTTVATILEVWTAAYNCKDIKIVYKGLTENDFSFRETYNVFKTNYPVTCTNDSMDEDGFALYLNGIVSPYDKRVITLQTFSGPEDDDFSCVIATI